MGARLAVPLERLDADGRTVVEIDGREIALFRVEDAVYALENQCPHERNPLADGEVIGGDLVCVYHRWRFDLATGACLVGERPARAYRVEVRDRSAWVELDDDR